MRNLTTTLTAVLLTNAALAQTSLPTGWDFDQPQPAGWTEYLSVNPGNTRYTNGSVGAACKLDGDGEYVEVYFSDVCGGVTYDLIGQGNATNDIFTVQESADGNTWTTLREFNDAALTAASTWTTFTDVPQATSRHIRWYFTDKQSGRNVGLDEISLIPQVPTNAQEIAISASGTPVVTNSTYVIGNSPQTTFTIANDNLPSGSALNITSAQITGPNAAEFTLSNLSTPTSINAASSIDFEVNFSTLATGSRFATLTILNDDANGDETTFVINLYGIGGDYATEPVAQPTDMNFSNVTSFGYNVAFSDASTVPENYIVLRSVGSAVPMADYPVDGTTYVKGDYINQTQVVHVGPAESFRPKYVVAGTDYHFAAFSVNGPEGFENYLTQSPLTAMVTTSGPMIGNYYNGIDPDQPSFMTDLQTRISQNYDQVYYSNYAPVMIEKFASRDTVNGQSVVTCVYSGYQHVYTGAFFYDVLSREHSWPHSWMPTYPDQEGMEYSDLHNLFPAHQDNANAVRSNRPFGEVVNPVSTFLDARYGNNAEGQLVYEPRDQHKGDAARAIFYMAAKWNGTGGSWALPDPIDFIVQYGQDQDVLKQWHWQDPPDAWEIARNDFIESEQGNRNPFIDSVNWVCYIDFENMTYLPGPSFPCTTTPDGIKENLRGEFSLSPNPTNGNVVLRTDMPEARRLSVEILDVAGRTVHSEMRSFNAGVTRNSFDLTALDAGMYHLVLRSDEGSRMLRVVRQ